MKSRERPLHIRAKAVRIVFMPRHMHARVAIHTMATVTGAVFAVRMGWGGAPFWIDLAWYCGGFVGFHVILAPFMAVWFAITNAGERWVRSIVEEELIRFDMRGYERQIRSVMPAIMKRSDKDHE